MRVRLRVVSDVVAAERPGGARRLLSNYTRNRRRTFTLDVTPWVCINPPQVPGLQNIQCVRLGVRNGAN